MNIVVCMKQSPDTEAKIVVQPDGSGINWDGVKFVVNPYDEFAVEQAIQLKEKFGGETTVVTLGPKRAVEAMRTALAMGIDRGVHIDDPALEGADAWGTAKALAGALKELNADLILGGKQAIDYDQGEVMAHVAEFLDLPHVSNISFMEMDSEGKKATVRRIIEGGTETYEVSLPAVMSCEKGLNEPRYASLPGIMKAKKKEIKELDLSGIGVGADEAAKKVEILKYSSPPERQAGKILEGEAEETAAELAKLLREEAKVI